MSFFTSFRFRLIFFTFLIEVIMLSFLVLNSKRVIESYLVTQAEVNIANLKESFNSSLAALLATRDYASIQSLLDGWVGSKNITYMAITKNDKLLVSSGVPKDAAIPTPKLIFSDESPIFDTAMEITYGGQKFGTLSFGVSTAFVTNAKDELLTQSFFIAMTEIILSGVLLLTIGLYLTKNLMKLTDASKLIADGNYEIKLGNSGSDEISILANSFSQMADEIRRKIDELKNMNEHLKELVDAEVEKVKQRDEVIHEQSRQAAISEMLVNIAHHWRQPLNVIALEASSIDDIYEYENGDREKIKVSLNKIVNQTKSLSSVITNFTKLYDHPQRSNFTLKHAIEQVHILFKATFESAGVKLLIIDGGVSINGDERVVVEIISALLQNALDIGTERGVGDIRVSIECFKQESDTVIEVSDNCGGVDEEILPKIFDPYSTTQFKARNKGLGLYMVSNLVKYVLKGSIEASNHAGGAKFTIRVV